MKTKAQDPALHARMQALIASMDASPDPATWLAGGSPEWIGIAHDHLAPLDAFDARVFTEVLQWRLEGSASWEDVLSGPVQRLADGRHRIDPRFARARLDSLFSSVDAQRQASVLAFVGDILRELERGSPSHLRLLSGLRPAKARPLFEAKFAEADAKFDLPTCQVLTESVASRPYLGPRDGAVALETSLAERERYSTVRVRHADAYFRTGRYFERKDLHERIEEFIWRGPWALNLFAKGGMGKTMFLQWLVARYCGAWLRRIPVARFDYDGKSPDQRAPELVAHALAEQLDSALATHGGASPFQSFLASYRTFVPPDFLDHFIAVLGELELAGPVILMLDTLEESMHDVARVGSLCSKLHALSTTCPNLRLILAGRYALADKAPELWAQIPGATALALREFEFEESAAFVRQQCGVASREIAEAVATRAGGLPFKVALVAEIAESERLNPTQVLAIERVDLEYLILRIVNRLDRPVQWALRYGVLPRRLTKDVFEGVILEHARREAAGGENDDTKQGLGERLGKTGPFGRVPIGGTDLWSELLRYAGGASWVTRDKDDPDILDFHGDVRAPMRSLLWVQKVTPIVHADLAAWFGARAEAAAREHATSSAEAGKRWARATAEHLFHAFHAGASPLALQVPLIDAVRRAGEWAPEEVEPLARVAFDSEASLDEAKPLRDGQGTSWLNGIGEATLLFLVADVAWREARTALGRGAVVERVVRLVGRVHAIRALEPSDRARFDVLRAEVSKSMDGTTAGMDLEPESRPRPSLWLKAILVDQLEVDPETRLRQLQVNDPADYRARLAGLFEEAVTAPALEPRVRREVGIAMLREHLLNDDPGGALEAYGRLESKLGSLDSDSTLWCLGAEARVLTGHEPGRTSLAAEASLFEMRFLLFADRAPEAHDRVGRQLVERTTSLPAELVPDAMATMAEACARMFDVEGLDRLVGRANRLTGATVWLWKTRMYLYGLGDLRNAESALRALPRDQGDFEEIAFERALIEVDLVSRRGELDDAEMRVVSLVGRVERMRPRHQLGRRLVGLGSRSDLHEDVEALPIEPAGYREALVRLYREGGFSPQDVERLPSSKLYLLSAPRARELELHGRADDALQIYLRLDDRPSVERLSKVQAAPVGPIGPVAAAGASGALSKSTQPSLGGEVRKNATLIFGDSVPLSPGAARAPAPAHAGPPTRVVHRHRVAPTGAPTLDILSQHRLGSSKTIEALRHPDFQDALAKDLALPPGADAYLLDVDSRLWSLPLEGLPYEGSALWRLKDLARVRQTSMFRTQRPRPPLTVAIAERASTAINFGYRQAGFTVEIASEGFGSATIAHMTTLLSQQGRSVATMEGQVPEQVVRFLALDTRVLVLEMPPATTASAMVWSRLLRNAFAAEVFDLSDLDVLLAVGPERERSAKSLVPAGALRALLEGRWTPIQVVQAMRGTRELTDVVLFCDQPHAPVFVPGSEET